MYVACKPEVVADKTQPSQEYGATLESCALSTAVKTAEHCCLCILGRACVECSLTSVRPTHLKHITFVI